MGPRAKLRRVAEGFVSIRRINQFARAGAQRNMLRNCGASRRSAASGARCWALFCDTTGRPHFPPTEEATLARSSFFGAGRSFNIYVAHLEKACPLLGVSTSWKSRAVQTAGFGLPEAGGRPHSPRPAVTNDQLIQLILSSGWQNKRATLARLSWAFLLPVLSERLPLCR